MLATNMPTFFDMFGSLLPGVTDYFLLESLNKHLGTEGLDMRGIMIEAAKRNMTVSDVIAMPELDGWEYSDGESYVCSCFVIAMWKAGGLFEGVEINSQEFTPKDVY